MPTTRRFPLLAAAVLSASPLYAATYTWNASSGSASSPTNWLNNAAPTSLDTDQLLFPASTPDYSNITFDSLYDPWTVNSIQYTGTTVLYLNGINTNGIQLAGANASISSNGSLEINAPLILAANTTLSSNVQINSTISGTGALTIPSTLPSIYNSTSSSTFSGGTTISSYSPNNFSPQPAALNWNYSTNSSNGPANVSFGSGNITLDFGVFHVNALNFSGQSDAPLLITNNFNVTTHGGRITAFQQGIAPPNVQFTGNISLAGTLILGDSNNTPFASFTPSVGQPIAYSGNSSRKDQTPFANAPTPLAFAADATSTHPIILSGNITNGNTTGNTPLNFLGGNLTISGSNNTYSGGTVIQSASELFNNQYNALGGDSQIPPTVTVTANSSLGSGNVAVLDLATLRLSSPTNIAPGRKIDGNGTLSLAYDGNPAPLLAPTFSGTGNYNIPALSTPINLSALGNGAVRVGSDANSTYTGPTIIPAADHVFRLGSADGTLTLPNSVLSDVGGIPASAYFGDVTLLAPNTYSGGTTVHDTVTAAADNALGSGNITIIVNGSLVLQTPHAYSSAATVSVAGHLIFQNNAKLPSGAAAPAIQPGGSIEFGSNTQSGPTDFYPDTLPILLNTSSIAMHGAVSETVGNVSFSGSSEIRFDNDESLTLASLSRNPGGLLTINRLNPTNGTLSTVTPVPLTHNMLSPSINISNGFFLDFATYSGNTIVPVSYSSLPAAPGDGNAIVLLPSTTSLAANTSIAALHLQANLTASTPTLPTLTITTGGIISDSAYSIAPNVTFGTEGILRYLNNLTISGALNAPNGFTANSDNGSATLLLSNPNNHISGPITILGGTLELASLSNAADINPITFAPGRFGGGVSSLQIDNSLSTARPILFNDGGEIIAQPGAAFTTSAPVSATGFLSLGGNIVINNTLTCTPDALNSGQLDVSGNITANTVNANDLTIPFNGALTLQGPTASKVGSFTIFDNGTYHATLSLNNTAIVVETTPTQDKNALLSEYRAGVIQASSNGTWSGYGIISPTAAADPAHVGIAVADNALLHYSTFHGQSVDNNSILITTALLGDANLDGNVDLSDLSTVLNNFGQSTPAWTSGNFDNAPTIDLTDLSNVLNNFGAAPLFAVQSPAIPIATPEPASLALALHAAPLLLKRRRP